MGYYQWIPCEWKGTYFILIVLSIGFFVLYGLFVPLFLLSLVYKKRKHLQDLRVKAWLGFLYTSYRDEMYWYELVLTLRRMLLALAFSVITQGSLQVAAVVCILIGSLTLQYSMVPFKTEIENMAEEGVAAILIFTYATLVGSDLHSPSTTLYYILLVLNSGATLILFSVMGYFIVQYYLDKKPWNRNVLLDKDGSKYEIQSQVNHTNYFSQTY